MFISIFRVYFNKGENLMHLSKRILTVLSLSAAGIAMVSGSANAAGFYIQEQSVSGLGSAFSGSVTNLNDPSTVYFNPAGMTKLSGMQAQAAAHLLIPSGDLTDTGSTGPSATNTGDGGNPYDPSPVPNGFYTQQLNDQFWFGLGITAPFGLANEYDDGWFGRFDSTKSELLTLDIQPSVAFKVNDKLSIGGGVNIQYADAELESAIGINAGPATEGFSTLEGDDWSYGYTLGLQYKPFETTTLGLSYRSAISHTLEGSVEVTGTTIADRDDPGEADLNLPDIATFGIAHELTDKLTIMGQATWFGWNNFQDIDAEVDTGTDPAATVQNYQTSWAFAAGAEYDYSDEWTFRGGMQYDQTPTTDEFRTTRTPDGDRTWLSAGATYSLNEKIDFDLAATYIWISEETISVTRNEPFSGLGGTTQVNADTDGNVGILAAGFTYKF